MPASPRADLDSLPAYVPGQSVPGAIKLASNETPLSPLPSVTDAIARASSTINRYPDMGAFAVVERLAAELGVEQDRIAVGCGSVSLCQQLIQAMCTPADEVLFGWRSFEAYPILTQVVGAQQRTVPLDANHVHDLDAMSQALTPATRVVFVCNPNNPTGTVVRSAELERFLDAVPDDVLVVLDEAYREFVSDPDVPDGLGFLGERDNVVVLRTFSKAYGLAGLRVGYLVAEPRITEAVRKTFIPFSVNALAQAAALASLDAADELLARCSHIAAERDRVRSALLDQGYEVPESHANFVWLPLGERTTEFAEHALSRKVVVRPFAGEGARVTVGTSEENDTLLEVTRTF
ncbi:histidinol-phosphate transaminase [Haloechinothrix sp. LS1_15]|uniref:histidinol-phosphate transaminase n=1 Tax=Haloechinothrix sp. LS1_15 TaxID=2652248 RepID=UPI002946BA4E|nr:histidinol-phosphate transaminase [Haloechinothrix sp. LS1_15]MDV6012397.1 histidinol-phosphate transaminase [Haloechinothrix sp. LS1_15]